VDDGILTNNRRLVTKNMWFNGTPLSAQARRALENERVTIVAHTSGVVQTIYEDATMDQGAYGKFSQRLRDFLFTPLNGEMLGNFLRHHASLQRCFQLRFERHGMEHYVAMETMFAYEHGSPYRVTDKTRDKLINDVEGEELMHNPLCGRIVFNDVESFVKQRHLDLRKDKDVEALKEHFSHDCLDADEALEKLISFIHVEPRLPDAQAKRFVGGQTPMGLDLDMSREEIRERLESIRGSNTMADMAFYAYRDLSRTDPAPFLAAAVQRNPVSADAEPELDAAAVADKLKSMPDESIYDEPARLAQPDEVWNYGRGDGAEKAVTLANVLRRRNPEHEMKIVVTPDEAVLHANGETHTFPSAKQLQPAEWPIPSARC
jgi:hypothetical protein